MSTPDHHTEATPPSATARRFRFGLQSLVLVLSVTASCVFIGLIGARFPFRVDATASREHRLSPRTEALLGQLDGQYEIVVAASRSSVDRRAYQRTRDVLDTFDRASDKVRVTFIDTGSSRGITEYDALLKRLSEQFAGEIDTQRKAADAAIETARAQLPLVSKLAADLASVKDIIPKADPKAEQLRTLLDDYAARARVAAFNLEQGIDASAKVLTQRVGPLSIPPIDDAIRKTSQTLSGVTTDLARLVRELKLVDQAADVPAVIRDRIKPLPPNAQSQVDAMRLAADSIDRLPKLTILSVARTLEQTSAALVIGPPRSRATNPPAARGTASPSSALPPGSITAIDFTSLFPPAMPEGATPGVSLDMRARTEELTVTALASLSNTLSPIIVLMHDQPARLGPEFRPFAALIDRLHMHGIDTVEWPVAIATDEPSLSALNPSGKRPVVYVSQTTAPSTPDAAERMKKMATSLARVIAQGKPILFSVNVSTLPGFGDVDPLVEFLPSLGIKADSGRPLLCRAQTPGGPVVLADFLPRQTVGKHPIALAINGLTTHFFWPVSIRPSAAPNASVSPQAPSTPQPSEMISSAFVPIMQIPADGNTWAESEWLPYARLPAAQRLKVIDPPAPDSPRDDAQGPWPIVVASEIPLPGDAARSQRLVVVGCSGWFLDDVTQQSIGIIDGRPVLSSPGNLELFEASVYWLARQEELIAQSPQALAVPVIRVMTPAQVQAVRWSLFAGLPLLVLLIGAVWRLVRG